jgi:hypothetical protein
MGRPIAGSVLMGEKNISMSDQAAAIASLVGEAVPHGIGASVAPDGAILRRPEAFPFSFAFHCAGRAFQAVAREAGDAVRIELTTGFGVLPYTQEDRARRVDILRVLEALDGAQLGWRITADQHVQMVIHITVSHEAPPNEIIVAVTAAVLPLQGWFDLLTGLSAETPIPTHDAGRFLTKS